jgi:hypothetical protein
MSSRVSFRNPRYLQQDSCHVYRTLLVFLFVLVFAWGCQVFLTPMPPATPTAVLLSGNAPAMPNQPAPLATAIPAVATATRTPAPRQEARPTASAMPSVTSPRIMALGSRAALVLRTQPRGDAAAAAIISGSQVVWAEARTADGQWLWVVYGDGADRAWLFQGDVKLLGEVGDLPEVGSVAARSLAPTATPQSATAPQSMQAGLAGRMIADEVNIRRGPGMDQGVIGQAAAGQAVTVIGRSREGDWLALAWTAGTGWVAARFVDVVGDLTALPALAAQTSGVTLRSESGASGTSPGGKLVFQLATGGDIYLVNADGSGLRRLTDGIDPVLSPDGTRVAYARWGSPHGVFVFDLRTGQERLIAAVNRPRGPTWRADGARVAFTHVTRTRTCVDLGFTCVDMEEVRRALGGRDCVDTPQGRRCVSDFPIITVDDNGLAVADPATGARDNLVGEGTMQSVQWRPDQDQLLFRGRGGLQTIRPGESPLSLGVDPNIGSPAWSPDGQRLVAQMHIHDRTEIVLLDLAGKVIKYLTQPPPTYERPGKPAPNNVAPAWSPDGQTIVFLSDRDDAWRFYSMASDGSNQRLFLPAALGQLPLRYDFAAERMVNWGR